MTSIDVLLSSMRSPMAFGRGMAVGRTTTPASKVSFAPYRTAHTSDGDHKASPRSCAVDIYRDDDGMMVDEMDEETPAEIAMLLASVADIAKREMSCDVDDHGPIFRALDYDSIPRFPDLSSSYGGVGFDGERVDDADRDDGRSETTPHPPPMAMMHFDHKKMRTVSLDHPNFHRCRYETTAAEFTCRHVPTPPPHEDEAIPTLLRWRNLSYDATIDHSHQVQANSTTTSPPTLSSSTPHVSALTSNPTRPRAVSMAEAVIENRPIDVPSAEVGDCATTKNDERPMKVILRKKFSWKNYPDVSYCFLFVSVLEHRPRILNNRGLMSSFQFAIHLDPRSSRSSSSVSGSESFRCVV